MERTGLAQVIFHHRQRLLRQAPVAERPIVLPPVGMDEHMPFSGNRFLSSLEPDEQERLIPHLRELKLVKEAVLFDQGDRIDQVVFPVTGVVSFLVMMAEGAQIEAGMIGSDGAIGISAVLDGTHALNRAIVQISGRGYSIPLGTMKSAAADSAAIRSKLYRHEQLLWAQAQQSAACNALHHIEEQLCRWILRVRDLMRGEEMPLTQEFLGQMLGVRRTSVTLAARHLQALDFIKYRRGLIEIVDLEGVREAACECYQAFRQQEEMLFASSN